jgi:Tfp pilus assembly protein PilO
MARKKKEKEIKVKKKKSSKKLFTKETFLAITMIGVCALLIIYVFVYLDYTDKTTQIEASNAALSATIKELQDYYDNMSSYETEIEEMKTSIDEMLDEYPAGVREEDIIMMAVQLQSKNKIGYDAINMEETESVYTIPYDEVSLAEIDGMDSDLIFARKQATYANTTTYDDLKSVIEQILNSSNRIGINSIIYSKDENNGTLEGSIDLYYYSIVGTGKEYTTPKITAYPAGTSDIFNSNKTTLTESEETEGEDANENGEKQ